TAESREIATTSPGRANGRETSPCDDGNMRSTDGMTLQVAPDVPGARNSMAARAPGANASRKGARARRDVTRENSADIKQARGSQLRRETLGRRVTTKSAGRSSREIEKSVVCCTDRSPSNKRSPETARSRECGRLRAVNSARATVNAGAHHERADHQRTNATHQRNP